MFCQKCGYKVPEGTKFCPKCGNSFSDELRPNQPLQYGLNNAQNSNNTTKGGTYHSISEIVSESWFMWVWLFLFPPVGMLLCFKNREKHPRWKIICGVFGVIFILLNASSLIGSKNKTDQVATTKIEQQEMKMSHNEKLITEAGKIDNITIEQAKEIIGAINKCGFSGEIKSIKKDSSNDNWEGAGEKAYNLNLGDPFSNFYVYLAPDNSIYSLRWAGKNFYKNNEVLLNMNEYVCTSDEKANLRLQAEKIVKQYLTVPKSAKFATFDWQYSKSPEQYMIKSSVEYKNAFNAEFEDPFEIVINRQSNKIVWLSIGSNVIIDNR